MAATSTKQMTKTSLQSARPQCRTPFNEKNGDSQCVLGNPRWRVVPACPERSRAQQVVLAEEKEEAKAILVAFRQASEVAANNDLVAKNAQIRQLEASSRGEDIAEAQRLRKLLPSCSHDEHLVAKADMRESICDAAELAKPILERLLLSFHDELVQYAAFREESMERLGLPLFQTSMPADTIYNLAEKSVSKRPEVYWELWSSKECDVLHSCREVCRNIRSKFDGQKHQTLPETLNDLAIPTLTYLCTDEEVRFSWL